MEGLSVCDWVVFATIAGQGAAQIGLLLGISYKLYLGDHE